MSHHGPSVIDLRSLDDARLVVALRETRELVARSADSVVLDLGERRTLARPAVDALLAFHRALALAGGRCAVLVGPALAAQISAAHPEGVLWAADRRAAIAALGGASPGATARCRRRRSGVVVRLAGALDLAALDAIGPALAEALGEPFEAVRFDLSEVTFADVAGLRAVAIAADRCRVAGARVRVHGATSQIRRLAVNLGWQERLPGLTKGPAPAPQPSALRATIARELARHGRHARVAVIVTDLSGRVTHWSSMAERLYGWSRDEALGRPITDLTVGPGDERVAQQILASVRTTGQWEGRFEVHRRDGSTLLADVRDTVVHDAHGRAVGLLGVSHSAFDPRETPLQSADGRTADSAA